MRRRSTGGVGSAVTPAKASVNGSYDNEDELFDVSEDEEERTMAATVGTVESSAQEDEALQAALFGADEPLPDDGEEMVSTVLPEYDETDSRPCRKSIVPFSGRRSSVITPGKALQASEPMTPIPLLAIIPASVEKQPAVAVVRAPDSVEKKQSRKRKGSETEPTYKAAQLTVPNTPNLRVLKRTRNERKLSSTTLELQRIQKEREELKKQKEKFQKTYQSVKTVASTTAVAIPCSVKPLTQPVDVKLRVDSRVRPEDQHATETFHSFAERVLAFCSNIGHSVKAALTSSPAPAHLKLTQPQPFELATEKLAKQRNTPILSTEELEERAMREHKPFKAKPVDPRVLNSAGDVGVTKVPRKPPTAPEPFSLESERLHKKALDEKAKALAAEAEKKRKEAEFKAAPLPETVKAPAPVAKPAPKPPTVAHGFALSSDARASERSKFEADRVARLAEMEKAAQEAAEHQRVRAAMNNLVCRLRVCVIGRLVLFGPAEAGRGKRE
jgi:hypothetical protein